MTHITIHTWGALNAPPPTPTQPGYIIHPTHTTPPPTPTHTLDLYIRAEATDDDYLQAARTISDLRKAHRRNLPLYPHSALELTTCPGPIDLQKLDSLARNNYSVLRIIINPPQTTTTSTTYHLPPNTPLYLTPHDKTPTTYSDPHHTTPALQADPKNNHNPHRTKIHTPQQLNSPREKPRYFWVNTKDLTPLTPHTPFPYPKTPPTRHTTTHNSIPITYHHYSPTTPTTPTTPTKGALVFLSDQDRPLPHTSSTAARLAHYAETHNLDFILPSNPETRNPEYIHALRSLLPTLTRSNLILTGTGTGATAITQHLARNLLSPLQHLNTTFLIHGSNTRAMPTILEPAHRWRINATMVFAHNDIHDTSKHLFDALGHPTRHLNTTSFTGAVKEVLNMKGVIR